MQESHSINSSDRGFTLIEVLVALTILAVSLTVLFSIFGHGLARQSEIQSRMQARVLALSLLAQAEAAPTLSPGETRGTAKPDLHWKLNVHPYGTAQDRESWPGNPVEIAATVQWNGAGSAQQLSLATLRLLPKEPTQ